MTEQLQRSQHLFSTATRKPEIVLCFWKLSYEFLIEIIAMKYAAHLVTNKGDEKLVKLI
jgi:hypothetical protein